MDVLGLGRVFWPVAPRECLEGIHRSITHQLTMIDSCSTNNGISGAHLSCRKARFCVRPCAIAIPPSSVISLAPKLLLWTFAKRATEVKRIGLWTSHACGEHVQVLIPSRSKVGLEDYVITVVDAATQIIR